MGSGESPGCNFPICIADRVIPEGLSGSKVWTKERDVLPLGRGAGCCCSGLPLAAPLHLPSSPRPGELRAAPAAWQGLPPALHKADCSHPSGLFSNVTFPDLTPVTSEQAGLPCTLFLSSQNWLLVTVRNCYSFVFICNVSNRQLCENRNPVCCVYCCTLVPSTAPSM